jgi:hypothetical protein
MLYTIPESKWTRKSFLSALFTVYNKLRAEARRNPQTIDMARLNKAFGLLQSVKNWERIQDEYQPTDLECGCKDEFYANRRTRLSNRGGKYAGPCKHRIAVHMKYEIERGAFAPQGGLHG